MIAAAIVREGALDCEGVNYISLVCSVYCHMVVVFSIPSCLSVCPTYNIRNLKGEASEVVPSAVAQDSAARTGTTRTLSHGVGLIKDRGVIG